MSRRLGQACRILDLSLLRWLRRLGGRFEQFVDGYEGRDDEPRPNYKGKR